jgi:hypothetical protein
VGRGYDDGIVKILGRRFRKPLTNWSGGQILEIYRNLDLLWGSDPLVHGISNLQADSKVANIMRVLKAVLDTLSEIHRQLSIPEPDLEVLSAAVETLKNQVGTFELHGTRAPCRYRLKFYDHAVMAHVCDMAAVLKANGLSLALVSSKFLDANKTVVKAIMARLPGGGMHKDCSFAHLPLVHGFNRCIATSLVKRLAVYAELATDLENNQNADILD